MNPFKVGQELLCIDSGSAELKAGDYYTVKCIYESVYSYTYELTEIPDFYWSHLRFIEVDQQGTTK